MSARASSRTGRLLTRCASVQCLASMSESRSVWGSVTSCNSGGSGEVTLSPVPQLARLPWPTPSKPALSSRTLASRLRRSLALMTEAPAVQPVPMLGARPSTGSGPRSYAEGGTVEVDPYADYYVPEMTDGSSYGYQVDETEPEPVEPEPVEVTQGSAVEAIAQALAEAHAQENPPISYEASFEDVSRPVGPVTGPSFEAFATTPGGQQVYQPQAENLPQLGRFEQGLGDAVQFIGEALSRAHEI